MSAAIKTNQYYVFVFDKSIPGVVQVRKLSTSMSTASYFFIKAKGEDLKEASIGTLC